MIDKEYRFAVWMLVWLCSLALFSCARDGSVFGCGVLLVVIGLLARNLMGGSE